MMHGRGQGATRSADWRSESLGGSREQVGISDEFVLVVSYDRPRHLLPCDLVI